MITILLYGYVKPRFDASLKTFHSPLIQICQVVSVLLIGLLGYHTTMGLTRGSHGGTAGAHCSGAPALTITSSVRFVSFLVFVSCFVHGFLVLSS